MRSNLTKNCLFWSAVALAYDVALRIFAAMAAQPVPRVLALGLVALYGVIGFTTAARFGITGALTVSAAAGAVVGTIGLVIGMALRVVPEVMPLSPLAEITSAALAGLFGAMIRAIVRKVSSA